MKRTALLFFILLLGLFSADAVLYPGAELDAELTRVARAAGGFNRTAYTTPDSFEKVCAFYRQTGDEIQEAKLADGRRKRAIFKLHSQGYQATVAWPRPGSGPKTSITISKPYRVTQTPAR